MYFVLLSRREEVSHISRALSRGVRRSFCLSSKFAASTPSYRFPERRKKPEASIPRLHNFWKRKIHQWWPLYRDRYGSPALAHTSDRSTHFTERVIVFSSTAHALSHSFSPLSRGRPEVLYKARERNAPGISHSRRLSLAIFVRMLYGGVCAETPPHNRVCVRNEPAVHLRCCA